MLELVLQTLAYAGVAMVVLVGGFYCLDALTPGKLGEEIMARNASACVLAAATLVSLGLILWFAIYFTGAGWEGLDNAAVFGVVGVGAQAVGFVVLDLMTPGKLGDICIGDGGQAGVHPGVWVSAAVQVAVALIVCAALT